MNQYLTKIAEMLKQRKGRKTKTGRIDEPNEMSNIPRRLQGGKVHASAGINVPVQKVRAA
jgi:hypothetical protein